MTAMNKQTRVSIFRRREIIVGGSSLIGGAALGIGGGYLTQKTDEKKRIAIGILGQSNEQNRVPPSDAESYPRAFSSAFNKTVRAPQLGNLVMEAGGSGANGRTKQMRAFGGMWFTVYDRLWSLGYDAAIANGAIGSASMVRDIAGSTVPWRPKNTGYFKQRLPIGPGDSGCAGSIIVAGKPERIFRCIKGRQKFATLNGGLTRIPETGASHLDYIVAVGIQSSGDIEPDWNSVVNPGETIIDGEIVWRCEGLNKIGLAPAATGLGGFNQVMGAGFWDPLGILSRLNTMMRSIQNVTDRWIIIQNGQSDYGASDQAREAYRRALESITQYFLDQGYNVAIGLSCFALTQETDSWEGLSKARDDALSTFEGNARVRRGANLYKELGTEINDLLQSDDVHLNGKGALAAGRIWADTFETLLK